MRTHSAYKTQGSTEKKLKNSDSLYIFFSFFIVYGPETATVWQENDSGVFPKLYRVNGPLKHSGDGSKAKTSSKHM